MRRLNEGIINILKDQGFELIGFCELSYFKDLEDILLKQEKMDYKTPFQVGKIEDKVFKISEYKSAIVVGLSYNKLEIKLNEDEVYFSSCAFGNDYHDVIKNKLTSVKEYLLALNYSAYLSVDNSFLDERYLAYKAGLGFYGKNGLLINEKYGSFFFIGIILTDAIFDYNEPLNISCLECDECIKACPTKAINDLGILNGKKCLSYLTQKNELNEDEKKYVNKCVYGCDICQNVCPHNNNLNKSNNFESLGNEKFNMEEFLILDKQEYNDKYKCNSSYWRGKKIIDRNIKIVMENNLKK